VRTATQVTRFIGRLQKQLRKRRQRWLERTYRKEIAGRGRDERSGYGGPGHGVW
jgi:hypothetical protein